MPAANVRWPAPLTRFPTLWPGQMGVPGTDNDRGERMHCTGEVFYVDPNYPGVSDARDGTSPTDPLRTVATALTKCQPYRGDVIVVGASSAWYYAEGGQGWPTAQYTTTISEEVEVTVSGVRLVGLQSSPLGVMWTPASNAGTCITVSAMDTVIEGFVFTEGATYTGCDAIYCEWDGTTILGENLTVRNCVFDDTVDTAIALEYSWYCDIHDNVFWECDEYGIYVDPLGSGARYVLIHRNHFHNCATAAISMANVDADENHIYWNSIYGDAAGTNNFINLTGASGNLVDHNTLACSIAQYDVTCSDGTSGAWIENFCINGPTTANPI